MESLEMYVQSEDSVNMAPRKLHLAHLAHSIRTIKVKIAKTVLLALQENTVLVVAVVHRQVIARQDTTVH
jgi:hypothetical protein